MIAYLNWIVISFALYGAYLNSKQDIRGFIVWMVTNTYLLTYNFYNEEWAQGFLFLAYLIISTNGLIVWRRQAKEKPTC